MADAIRPVTTSQRRSTLEADGCSLVEPSHLSKLPHNNIDTNRIDSGVSLSFRDEMPSFTGSDVRQPRCQSLAYESSDDVTLNQISELNIDDVTYTSQPTTCGVREKWRQVLCDQDDDGDTKLHLAIIEPHVEATRWLICATAAYYLSFLDVANYEFHQTALHLAVITDQPNIVRLLVICGASTNLRDRRGNTALHLACLRGRAGCVEEMTRPVNSEEYCQLMEYCQQVKLPFEPRPYQLPDLTAKDYEGRSCLHLLQSLPSSTERLRIIDYLVRNCSANINIQEGKGGCTLLHLSVKQRDSELFTYLLHLPCVNVNLPTYSQHTALDIADSLNYNDFVQQLVAVHAQHSPSYITNDSSSSDTDNDDDRMDEYDDLVVGGQRLTLNSR